MLNFANIICSVDMFEQRMEEIFTVVGIVFAVIVVVSIIVTICFVRLGSKTTKTFVNKVKQKISENQEYEKTKNLCEYCGGNLKDGESRCQNCGAQRKK